MKGSLALLAFIGTVCAGGVVVYLNPSLVSGAEHIGQQGAQWASGELAHVGAAPTPSAAAPATTNANATPITLITPSPATAALPDWTPADCAWAENVMNWDHSLDAAEAQRIASGQDTRYGTGPDVVQVYFAYAAAWQTALNQITEVCNATGMPTAAERAVTIQAFTSAIAGHVADVASKAPDDSLARLWYAIEGVIQAGDGWAIRWDSQWIGYYQRLTTMFNELPA